MFEQELKDFIASEVSAGNLINADLTGINEVSKTAEAKGHILNPTTNDIEEKWLYFYMKNGSLTYNRLVKLEEPQVTTPPGA